MKQSLSDRLVAYFLKHHSLWIAKGDLQRLVAEYTSYTPENVGRRLRELVEAGKLEVEYRRGHAFYRHKRQFTPVEWFEQLPDRPPSEELA
jgi:DNA-binding transcriptional ArsR family regulator